MRVLFVYPSIDTPVGFNHGLAAMSGVLKAQGHETRLIHVNEGLGPIPTPDEVLATVRDYAPGVIGFSCMSQQYPWASEVARHLRASGVEAPIVVGGVHCTMVPDEVVEDDWWDGVFVGECDDAFAEYVRRLEAGEDVSTTANLRMKRDGAVIRNAVGAFPDLKTIAPKDYELFDVAKILDVKKGWVSILTSRGCPYKCTYCFNKEIVDLYKEEGGVKSPKEYLRHYDVDRIVGELLDLKRRYPGQLRTVIFDDDLFTLNKGYVIDFCRAYKEAGVDLPFVVNAHVQVFNDDIAFALKEAGCRIVKYGLESGSDRLRREVLWRFMPNKKIVDAFAAAHRYDLHTSAFIMAGLPTETKEEIEETLQLCADIGMGRFRWAIFYPFPGTAGYTISKDLGLIDFEKAKGMGNYFDGSCLKLGPEMDLYLEKITGFCHWYVNARTDWASRGVYEPLVADLEAMDREAWEKHRPELLRHDRELSERLIAEDVLHYSRQYSHVMGVRSDFVKWEREKMQAGEKRRPTTYTLD
jgi:anaerobic magnesium-protoporphyrin IX monomethyl ester cyclase